MTEIKTIAYDTAKDFLLPRHYSGRIPSISYAYGCYNDGNLVGVLTVGNLLVILYVKVFVVSNIVRTSMN